MTSNRAFLVALLTIVGGLASVAAQGTPTGSTKVAGPPDSALSSFVAFLRAQGDSVIRLDSSHHRVSAKIKDSDDPIVFAFDAKGDSTAVSAQGTKGGMAAVIFGLGVVDDWLKDQRAHSKSAPHEPS